MPAPKTVESFVHEEAARRNIPTAELETVMSEDDKQPRTLRYPRNTDLDPQLVWRGKDEQDWSDLVVQAPPLYIQEKVHPQVLIDDLRRQSEARETRNDPQVDLFADFNGIADEDAKTEFYQHDQNWTNRMILGDSLQVMASLAEREGLRGQVQCIYLDPPYNQHAYLSNYHIWETLVLQDQPEAYGIARKRIDCRTRKSPFNSKRKAAEALQSVLENINIENVLLSFSNEGVFTIEDINELMSQKGQVTTLWREHKRYVGSRIGIYNPSGKRVGKISHTKNREYLFLASPNPAVHEAVSAQLAKKAQPLAAVV